MAETPSAMEGLPPSLHLVELLVRLLLVLQLATQLRTSGLVVTLEETTLPIMPPPALPTSALS
jgi:hypothetical protein